MDLIDWNACLFDHLVVRVGRAGDPLYLYADAEVLAEAAGAGDPSSALADFVQAFRATNFADQFRRAVHFHRTGSDGIPPYLAGLVMTVLAVTLEPIGAHTSNVYGRQRQLLNLNPLEPGAPPTYGDFVPDLWLRWNQWLEGPGAVYGVPTARPLGTYTRQGYARSQSFIRAKDKQDVYAFFQACALQRGMAGTELVDRLLTWLRAHGVGRRLASVAADPALRDELAQCLEAALRHWSGETQARREVRRTPARVHWEDGELSLVVDLRKLPGALGVELVDFQLTPYTVTAADPVFHLTAFEAHPSEWLDSPVYRHQLTPEWSVAWEPHDLMTLEGGFGGRWTEVEKLREGFRYRVLLREEAALPEGFETDCFGAGTNLRWATFAGARELSANHARAFAGASAAAPRRVLARLEGGMPVRPRGAVYLNGGEPTLRLLDVRTAVRVYVDDREQSLAQADWSSRGDANGLYFELADLALNPGPHSVRVEADGDRVTNHRFESVAPRRALKPRAQEPALPGRVIPIREGFSLLAIVDGHLYEGEPGPQLTPWVDELGLDRVGWVEPAIDFVPRSSAGASAGCVLAWRDRPRGGWSVLTWPEGLASLQQQGITFRSITARDDTFLALLAAHQGARFLDDACRRPFQDAVNACMRSSLTRTGFIGQQTNSRTQRQIQGTSALREDVVPAEGTSNCFDDFVAWLSELGPEGATASTCSDVYEWIRRRPACGGDRLPSPTDAFAVLEALGYVERDRAAGRVRAAEPALHYLANGEGLSFLTGARSEEMLAAFTNGDDSLPERTANALQEVVSYLLLQVDERRTPRAPSTHYVRLCTSSVSAQAADLGAQLIVDAADRMVHSLPLLGERLTDEDARFFRTPDIQMARFTATDVPPFGRWRTCGRLPHIGEHFLRAQTSRGSRYLWWDAARGELIAVGWIYGVWAFQARIRRTQLLTHDPDHERLLVRSELQLPDDLARAATLRVGLLPRRGRGVGDQYEYVVYENVPSVFANLVAERLEQHVISRRIEHMEWL